MTADDIGKVVNLKHVWEFIMNKSVITYPSNYAFLCQINALVEEGCSYTAGRIRSIRDSDPIVIRNDNLLK